MKERIITGTVGVWLTGYSIVGPADLANGDGESLIRDLTFSPHDMKNTWTRIGTAAVTITLEPNDQIVTGKIDALRAQQTRVRAEAERTATDIERQIQTLLAITLDPAVTA